MEEKPRERQCTADVLVALISKMRLNLTQKKRSSEPPVTISVSSLIYSIAMAAGSLRQKE